MASSRMMSYSKASLQHLIHCHLRAPAAAAAATLFVNNSSGSLIPPPELRPFTCRPIGQEAAGSDIQFAQAPFQLWYGLTAENFVKRIECRGCSIKIEDDVDNYDDDEAGDFDEDDEDYDSDTISGEMDDDDDSDGDFDEEEDDGGDYRRYRK